MAILAFQKPDKVIMLDSTETFGKFEFRPLEPGYGITIGNALRRILLSSLEGFAITSIKIMGVDHEFATIPGVIESVIDIVLNLKQVRFKRMIEGEDSDTILLVPGMKLDLDELVYSEVMMSLPMKHLCNAECKGICFKCGKNLNEGKCDCPEKEIDPRLQALADLLKDN